MSHSVTLTWQASPDPVAGYNVYRGTNPPGNEGATPINPSLVTVLTYVDTNVTAGGFDVHWYHHSDYPGDRPARRF